MPVLNSVSPPFSLNGTSPRVLVIGGGVVGISSAISLREAGFEVTVVAEKYENITSNVAGALWEWPPAVCGQHADNHTLDAAKGWCMVSYEKFKEIHAMYGESESGVYLQDVFFYFNKHLVKDRANTLRKMNELKDKVDGFAHGLDIIPDEVDPLFAKHNIKDCYKHMAPMIDTDVYMPWIQQKARNLGCILLKERIDNHLILDENLLRKRYNADAIIACPGLGSIPLLAESEMYALRGALVRVKQPERVLTSAHCISHEENTHAEQDIVFITPRGKDTIVLGGLAENNRWDYGLSLDDPIIQQMYQGCLDVVPALKSLELDPSEPVRTGLRPMALNMRVERIPGTNVVVNYGHGGAGVTLSWGCAEQVVKHVKHMLNGASMSETAGSIDPNRPTTFILQDLLPFGSEVANIKFMNHNYVLICSRRGVTKLPARNFVKFNEVHLLELYELGSILQKLEEILLSCGLSADRCRVVTNDEYSALLSGQIREALGIPGPNVSSLLPFFDKDVTKKVIGQTGPVRTPNYVVFSPEKFQTDPQGYVEEIMNTVGEKLFIKPVIGVGSEKTWRLDSSDQLYHWCKTNSSCDGIFEIDERISGELFNTTIIRANGQTRHFFAMHHNRPSDEYLQGHKVGNIIVSATNAIYHTLQTFSETVLHQLKEFCEDNGVYNIDLFVESDTGEPVLIEITAGAPGGLVSNVIKECCGIGLDETSLVAQMGHAGAVRKQRAAERFMQAGEAAGPALKDESNKMMCYTACCLHPPKAGVVKRIIKPDMDSWVAFFSPRVAPGQRLSAPTSMLDVALLIVITNPDLESLTRDFETICSEDYIIMEEKME